MNAENKPVIIGRNDGCLICDDLSFCVTIGRGLGCLKIVFLIILRMNRRTINDIRLCDTAR